MLKLKKAVMAALVGVGLGAAASAWALPSYETCFYWWDKCQSGDAAACATLDRLACEYYGLD